MNRNYKVVWNASLNCFMAVAEYAKSRGKSSGHAVSANEPISVDTVKGGAKLWRLSTLCIGIAAASVSMQTLAAYNAGAGSSATGSNSVAVGDNATASAGQSIAIGGAGGGQVTTASGDQSIAIGANVVSEGSSSIAIGGDDLDTASRTNKNGSLATNLNGGEINTIFKKYSDRNLVDTTNQYPNTASSGAASVAIGVQAVSSGALSTAFGTQTNATGVASSAFGVSASATKEGSVALGAGSKTDGNATKVTKQTVNGVEFSGFVGNSAFAGTAADAGRQVSVGLIGNERQIKNVAPGELSATSTDAINGSQIFSVSNKLVENIKEVKATADAVADGTAGLVQQANTTAPITVGAQTGGTSVSFANKNNIDRQLTGVAAGTANNDAVNVSQLNNLANQTFKIQANSDTATAVKSSDTVKFVDGKNINIARTGNNITVGTADNLTADSVTTGATTLSNTGVTISAADPLNNVTLTNAGLNNGNNKITGVAAGSIAQGSTDAINGSQLFDAADVVKAVIGGNTTNTNGLISTTNIGGTGENTIDGAISIANTQANKSLTFTGNVLNDTDANGSQQKLGSTLNISGGATAASSNDNVKTVVTDGNIDIQLADAPTFSGKVTANGFDANNQKVTNVADGATTNGSTDAINGGQLNTAAGSIATHLGGGASYDSVTGTVKAPTYTLNDGANTAATTDYNNVGDALGNLDARTTTNTGDIATNTTNIAGLTNGTAGLVQQANTTAPITVGAASAGDRVDFAGTAGARKLTGIAKGTAATDAVNFSQLAETELTSSVVAGNNTSVSSATTGNNTAYTVNAEKSTVSTATDSGLDVVAGTTTNDVTDYAVGLNAATKASLSKADSAIQTISSTDSNLIATQTGNSVALDFADAPTFSGKVTANGFDANNQKITNVADGATTNGSTDAINGGQLNTAAGSIATHLGGGASYDSVTGTVKAPTYTLNDGANTAATTDYNNVGDALGNLDARTTTNTGDIATNTTNIAGLTNGTAGLVQQANTTAPITVGAASAGDRVDFTGTAGARKLTGIAKGTAATDAVNFSQLAETELTSSVVAGNNTSVSSATTGNNTAYTVNAEKSTVSTATDSGLDVVAGTTTNDVTDYAVGLNAATKASLSKADSAIQTISSTDSNLIATQTGNSVALDFADAPTFSGKVTANGFDANNQKVTNVADGATTNGSTDAINGGQLNTAAGSIATHLGGGASYDSVTGTVKAPTYTLNDGANTAATTDYNNVGDALGNLDARTTTNTGDIATNTTNIAGLTNGTAGLVQQANTTAPITVGAASAGDRVDFTGTAGARKLTGIAKGTAATDAVNFSQLAETELTSSVVAGNNTSVSSATTGNNTAYTVNAEKSTVSTATDSGLDVVAGTTTNDVTDYAVGLNAATKASLSKADSAIQTISSTDSNLIATQTGNSVALDFADAPTFSGKVTANGFDANNQKITNVADGATTNGSTDAINGGQLNTAAGSIATHLGGGASYDSVTGTVKAPTYTLNDGANTAATTDYNNVGDALGNLDARTTTNTGDIATNTTNIAGLTNGTAGLVQQANTTAPITVGAASAGDRVDFTGTAGARKLTGIAKGTAATDAVNFSQLAETELTSSVVAGNNTSVSSATTGNNTAYTVNAEKSTVSTATDSGLDVVAGTTTNDVTDYAVGLNAATKASLSKADSAIQTISSTDSNLIATQTGNSVALDFADAPTFSGKVTANGFDANNQKITNVADGASATDAVNFGQLSAVSAVANNAVQYDDSTKTSVSLGGTTATAPVALTNVKEGALNASSTDAVNGSQLNATNTNVTTNQNNITKNAGDISTNAGNITKNAGDIVKAKSTVSAGDNVEVTTGINKDGSANYIVKTKNDLTLTSVTTGNSMLNTNGLTIIGGPSVTSDGINAGNNKITNVAAGTDNTDAVNVGQLTDMSDTITAGAVRYEVNQDGTINYDRIIAGNGKGNTTVIEKNADGEYVVVSGGTVITNVANGVNADDAINKGQLDSIVANNITDVEIKDQNGNVVDVKNVTQNVVNTNVSNSYDENKDSLFLTYNKEGQDVTDRLTIGETVQKMNTEGVKFAHTNASETKGAISNGVTNDSSAGGFDSTAIGVNAIIQAGADSTIALGHDTEASKEAKDSVVIGKGSKVSGASSVAIGDNSQANGTQSISIGTGNIVNGNNSGAFGDPSIIDGSDSYSVGNNNTVDSDDTFVLGNSVTQTVAGSVVLGTGSGAITGAGIIGFGATGNAAIMATTSTTGAVAVGNAANGVYRQVTGVAAGTADSDAVNVSQLKAVNDNLVSSNAALSDAAVQYDKNQDGTINKGSITLGGAAGTTITNVKDGNIAAGSTDAVNGGQLHNLGSDVAGIIGGDAKYDANGNLTASNIGGTGKGNINDAIASINQNGIVANENIQANTSDIKDNANRLDAGISFGADEGDSINQSIGNSGASFKFEGGNNITTSTANGNVQISLDGNIEVDSVTTGDTVVNDKGVSIKDGPSMTVDGFNAANTVITGVEAGVDATDAVNFGQLSALDKKLGDSVNALGYRIGEVEDDANAGISAAMAMSSLPQAYIPGKSMVGGGVATYNGQSAVAIGVSKVSDNGRWVIKVNGTADTQGNAGGAVGAGFHF